MRSRLATEIRRLAFSKAAFARNRPTLTLPVTPNAKNINAELTNETARMLPSVQTYPLYPQANLELLLLLSTPATHLASICTFSRERRSHQPRG
jgi:hypothetical protein